MHLFESSISVNVLAPVSIPLVFASAHCRIALLIINAGEGAAVVFVIRSELKGMLEQG